MPDPLILDSRVRCGVVLGGQTRDELLDAAPRMEAAGFDSIWVGDHISFHIPVLESLTLLSFAAAVTERVRLGTSVYLVPLRHPTTSAKVISTLDVLSGGRLSLGVGVGGEFPPEFEAAGVPVGERGSRTDEGIEIFRKLWSQDRVEHAGRHFRFGPISIDPKPLQPGGPPILVGGRKAPSMRRAGRLGDGYMSHMCSPEHFAANLESIAESAAKAGRRDLRFETLCFIFTLIDDDYEAAHARASQLLSLTYRADLSEAARRYCLLGRAEDCLEQMQRFVAAGARQFILVPLMDHGALIEIAEAKILPEIPNLRPGSAGSAPG
jgi:probable F420-dependent oxidoreductase